MFLSSDIISVVIIIVDSGGCVGLGAVVITDH